MYVLIGVLVVILGFMLRVNALVVVVVAGIVTGFLGGMTPLQILNTFGTGFAGSRSVTVFAVVLPVIGLIEHFGLQEQARRLISKLSKMTPGWLYALYMFIRQGTSAIGLMNIMGHAQTVRPLIYPMALGSAERKYGERLTPTMRERLKGMAAASDNIGAFFGEDVFVAVGSILLITGFVDSTYKLKLDALQIALWAIPTGLCALALHVGRMRLFDRRLDRMAAEGAVQGSRTPAAAAQSEEQH
ncbi:MAG: DUF969 domain-containing protein [Microbacteriaceae bacterium]|jgi:uncharacterized membrane protein|nr:DUF969 domain-containing protein [Microbacteriaceae bacterium]MCI1207344.1 DUF969 domain-containing protein [Microbacteriaceae bacterium]